MTPLVDRCVLWNTLNNVAAIEASEIGPPGVIGGVLTFDPQKHGDGPLITSPGQEISFHPLVASNSMAIEYWGTLNGWSVTNGQATGAYNRRPWMFSDGSNTNYQVYLNWNQDFNALQHQTVGGNVWNLNGLTDLDIPDDTLYWQLIVWDRGGIGGGLNIRRFYIGDALVGSSNAAIGDITIPGDVDEFLLGNFFNGTIPAQQWFNNIKVYQVPSNDPEAEEMIAAIRANRNNPGFPSAGFPNINKFNRINSL